MVVQGLEQHLGDSHSWICLSRSQGKTHIHQFRGFAHGENAHHPISKTKAFPIQNRKC